jgi:large subunit ribosomal protein L21
VDAGVTDNRIRHAGKNEIQPSGFVSSLQTVVHSIFTPVVPTHSVCSGSQIEVYMHAILETGGKQYRVATGDVLRVEKLTGDVGSEVELPAKAAFKEGGELVAGGTVKATILGAGRGEKIIVFKFKRKKQYKKTIGHRQSFTEVKVGEILV